MNLSIVDITPLPLYLCPTVNRPPNTKEFNYKSIVIEDDGNYYFWSRGVSISLTKDEYEQVRLNPKLYYSSTSFNLHERVNQVLEEGNHG
jgi:hypothetical protein